MPRQLTGRTEYGLVLRMQQDMSVSPDWPDKKAKGEWRSMGVSNFLLSASSAAYRTAGNQS